MTKISMWLFNEKNGTKKHHTETYDKRSVKELKEYYINNGYREMGAKYDEFNELLYSPINLNTTLFVALTDTRGA